MVIYSVSAVKEMPPQDQVFLNFRADVQWNFVSHLNRALVSENINVYWDRDEKHKVVTVKESLRRIEESRIALAIFSPMYPQSSWCVRELDRIMDCTVKGSLVTIPIFYKVEPLKVKYLEGDFGSKFKRLAHGNVMEEKKWEEAFKFVSTMTGITIDWNSDESKMISRIVTDVKRVLKQISSEDPSENIDTGKHEIKQRLEVCSVSAVKEMPPQDQVFLNFRADVQWNFVSHLNRALVSENINVYWDRDEKNKVVTVKESLRRIEESRIALAIFSPRYPESSWCVRELDRIMDCTVKGSLVTIPIFYKVEPLKVKYLEGDFGSKFKRLADGNVMEEKWATAFKFISTMTGITVDGNSDESKMIGRIVTDVKRVLKQISSENIDTGKYGIKQRLKYYISLVLLWREFSSKKNLFLALCGHPVLIYDGNKRLWLEKASGKRCIMLPAMDLNIKWADHLKYWRWEPEARFGRIAKLIEVCCLDISGSINTRFLSPATRYSAYIVFKKGDGCEGFKDTPVEAIIEEEGKEPSRRFVCFDEAMDDERNIVKPKERPDGWMEVELVEFFTEELLHSDEIEIRVVEGNSSKWKRGMIFLGIEIRPAKIHYANAKSKDGSEVTKEMEVDVKRVLKENRSENIDTGTRIRQSCTGSREKQIAIIGCLLLLFLCLQHIVYTTTPLLGEGGGDIGKIVDIPKVLEYIPAERTKITIDKDSDFPAGEYGAKPDRFCSSDAKTNANLLDSKDKTFGTKQHLKELGEKLDLSNIAYLLLLFFCLPYITYAFITLLRDGRGAIDRNVVDVPKVLEYIHAEPTDNAIDKSVTCGAKPVRSSSDPTTNADLLDSKIIPPQIQVFINFRGVQLRNNFVGYLVHALRKREVNVFIDNYEKRGEDLHTLFKRIENSGIAIAVFSSMYTESKWCLDELVKIKERVHQGLLKVIPIFYKVSPTDVKRLKGEFGDHFRDKEHRYGSDSPLIKAWKEAIVFITHKHALVYDEKSGALEIDFVETIVKEVLEMLQSISTGASSQSSN